MNTRLSEDEIKKQLNKISRVKEKNERLAWKRKYDKLKAYVGELEPIENEILELIKEKKMPLVEAISDLRAVMVKECVHPKDFLVHKGNHVECKFCNTRLGLVDE